MNKCPYCAKRHERSECGICADNPKYISRFKLDSALEAFCEESDNVRDELYAILAKEDK